MTIIKIITSDKKIWKEQSVYSKIISCVIKGEPFTLDFCVEGPDINSLELYNFLNSIAQEYNFSLENITIRTDNLLENHNLIKVIKKAPTHLLDTAKEYIKSVPKHNQLKYFGIFIGRSNAPRLHLASYINSRYFDKRELTYHFNLNDDFFRNNIGIENIINQYNTNDIRMEAEFLSHCPVRFTDIKSFDKTLNLNPAQQLLSQDKDQFLEVYRNFFVEIVCETYFSGNTFFPTEKIWRPIFLKTPFMVQGPVNFLKNLKKMGFRTFNEYWDESYDEDGGVIAIETIKRNVDKLATLTNNEIYLMYQSMKDILEHNYQKALTLTESDFYKVYDQK